MSSHNLIKSKLTELEGGKFQRLCDDWLHRKGYENINPIGMMNTTDRVVKGTPDCLFMQKNGKYIFSEYTVQQARLANMLLLTALHSMSVACLGLNKPISMRPFAPLSLLVVVISDTGQKMGLPSLCKLYAACIIGGVSDTSLAAVGKQSSGTIGTLSLYSTI